MSDKPTADQIAKLPKWAQDHINKLERERYCAVRDLNAWVDSQTPSPVKISEYCSTGETQGPSAKTRYVQTRRLEITWGGVELSILLRPDKDNGSERICLQWSQSEPRRIIGYVAFVPTSFQSAELISRENMG